MMLVNMARMPRRVPSWNVRMKAHTYLLFTMQIVHVEAERCQRIVNSLRGSRAGGVLRYLADLFWRHAGHDPVRLQAGCQHRGDRHHRICGLQLRPPHLGYGADRPDA